MGQNSTKGKLEHSSMIVAFSDVSIKL